jgi:predicted transcriptional regulator
MISPSQLTELIEQLAPEDRAKVEEYALLLQNLEQPIPKNTDDVDEQYRKYILEGIARGLEDKKNGNVFTSSEAKERLSQYLRK